MVEKIVADYSKKYLYEIFSGLKPNEKDFIGLIGGWAVEFTLEKLKVKHIGSRDIDIFFDANKIDIKRITQIIESHGFCKSHSFRWCKFIDRETGCELTEEEQKSRFEHNIIRIFVDVLANKNIERVFYEPLLNDVLNGQMEYFHYQDIDIMIPKPRMMAELKIKTACERNGQEKRSKDIADLFSIIRNSKDLWELDNGKLIRIANIRDELRKRFREKLDELLSDGTISGASELINIKEDVMIDMLKLI